MHVCDCSEITPLVGDVATSLDMPVEDVRLAGAARERNPGAVVELGGVHPAGGWQMHAFDESDGPGLMRLTREGPDLLLLQSEGMSDVIQYLCSDRRRRRSACDEQSADISRKVVDLWT